MRRYLPRRIRSFLGRQILQLRIRLLPFESLWRPRPLRPTIPHDEGGGPVDRIYINGFMERHREDIAGDVLEAGGYMTYGALGGNRVGRHDILYPYAGFPDGTVIGNLETGEGLRDETYDCLILPQTFQCIFDLPAAVLNARRVLRPGGVLLATVPATSPVWPSDDRRWGDYWRFTERGVRRLFEEVFGPKAVTVASHGNILAVVSFLHNLPAGKLRPPERDLNEPMIPLIISVRAVRLPTA